MLFVFVLYVSCIALVSACLTEAGSQSNGKGQISSHCGSKPMQISKFYAHIISTEVRFYIFDRPLSGINVVAVLIMCG